MEFQIKSSNKWAKFVFSFKIPFINNAIRFTLLEYSMPTSFTKGMSSKCQDGFHVLFFDWDDVPYDAVVSEIKFLQEFYKLSSAYVFENDLKDSYHAVILDKFSLRNAYKILINTSSDSAFINAPKYMFGKEWVLRVTSKGKRKAPKFKELIKSKWDIHETSTAHRLFLQKWYGVPALRHAYADNFYSIPLVTYNTASKV